MCDTLLRQLSSTDKGLSHWWHQRVTSIFMTPLSIWFLYFLHTISSKEFSVILAITQKPLNIAFLILTTAIMYYHAVLGMQTVIEDYVSNLGIRYFLIITVQFFSIITVTCLIVSLLYLQTI